MHFVPADRKVIKCDLCDGEPQCVRFCDVKAVDLVEAGDVGLQRGREAARRLQAAGRKASTLSEAR
jgi:Fe-S-cluster-containing hydrogenase component 2